MLHWRVALTSTAAKKCHGGRQVSTFQNCSSLCLSSFALTYGFLAMCMRHSTFSWGGLVQSQIQSKADNLARAWWSRSENSFANPTSIKTARTSGSREVGVMTHMVQDWRVDLIEAHPGL